MVAAWPKLGTDSVLVLGHAPYHGNLYVSLRRYWRTPDGELRPTRKGVTFHEDLTAEVAEALQRLELDLTELAAR